MTLEKTDGERAKPMNGLTRFRHAYRTVTFLTLATRIIYVNVAILGSPSGRAVIALVVCATPFASNAFGRRGVVRVTSH